MNAFSLEVKGLKKSFGFKPVLRGVDLTLCSGESMALMGANGVGKTTLLRILAGLTRPGAGSACINGLDLVRDAQRIRHLVGFVAHQPYLYDELTALENLLFFGRMYSVRRCKERAGVLLERVGLAKRAGERTNALSRGQVQRLALARALLHEPRLLLLDEPDTGLDEEGIALLGTLLQEHRQGGGTVLLTTHHLERALQWSERIGLLSGGRLTYQSGTGGLEAGSVREVYQEALR